MIIFIFLLLFLSTASSVWADPEVDASLEDELYLTIYRQCWQNCFDEFKNKTTPDVLRQLVLDTFDLEKHTIFCSAYNSSRSCASHCTKSEDHSFYIRPFFRRNYLNEFICVKHYDDFRRFLPCYRNPHSLETLFKKCSFFALEDSNAVEATTQTCGALKCVMRYIPGVIRQECQIVGQGKEFPKLAGDLLERIVAASLREKLRLNKMLRLCQEIHK